MPLLYQILIIALLVPTAVILQTGFPFLGLTISFLITATLVFKQFKHPQPYNYVLLAISLLLALSFTWRVNPFLLFLNFIAYIYSITLSIQLYRQAHPSLITAIFSPLTLLVQTLNTPSKIKLQHFPIKIDLSPHLKGILLTIGLLFIVLPLLASTNPLFDQLLTNFFNLFNIDFFNLPLDVYLFRLGLFLILIVFIPKLITIITTPQPDTKPPVKATHTFTIPKLAIALILIIFFITQIQLYFTPESAIQQLTTTYSTITREVFFQLSIVTGIVFWLIYNDNRKHTFNLRTSYLLLLESAFLMFVAYQSIITYHINHGLTFIRLYGYTIAFFLTITLALLSYIIHRQLPHTTIIKPTILTSLALLILINIANFDRLIYVHPPHLVIGQPENIDYQYLAYNLTADCQCLHTPALRQTQYNWTRTALHNKYHLFPDIRSFNLSEYNQYRLMLQHPESITSLKSPSNTSLSNPTL